MKKERTHFKPKRFYHSLLSRFLRWVASWFSEIEVVGIHNIPKKGGVVVVCNHLSYFDAFALATALDESGRDAMVMAKAELFENKLLGWVLTRVGVIPVQRGTDSAANSLHEATKSASHGELVGLFPEGTIPLDGKLGPFKSGAARMALAANVPVVPVAMVGTHNVIAPTFKKFKRRLWANLWRQSKIVVTIGEPVFLSGDPENRADVEAATAQLRSTVLSMLGEEEILPEPRKIRKRDVVVTTVSVVPIIGFLLARAWRVKHKG